MVRVLNLKGEWIINFIRRRVNWIDHCLNDYLSNNYNKECVKNTDKLKEKLKQLGFGWG